MSEPPVPSETDSSAVTEQLYQQGLGLLMALQKDAERTFEALELSPSSSMALHCVAHHATYPKELAERLAAPPSAVSVWLGDLAERGLLERHTDPDDRRRVRLELTPAGREALARLEVAWRGVYSRRLAALSEAGLAQLSQLQQKLLAAL